MSYFDHDFADLFLSDNQLDTTQDTSGPKLDAISESIKGLEKSITSIADNTSTISPTTEDVQKTINSLKDGLATKADVSALSSLQSTVTKLQTGVAANTTTLTDLQQTVSALSEAVTSKMGEQETMLKDTLNILQHPPLPPPSFSDEDRQNMQMVADFGVLISSSFYDVLEDDVKVLKSSKPPSSDDDKDGEKN